jgi:hypothetical protein
VDIRVVQELMMHDSLATTEIYAAVSERRKREGILMLEGRPIPTVSGRGTAVEDEVMRRAVDFAA